ncbi:uclacyanin-3-like [Arachis hypogaea]|nr:uclacyanin-3-like [Arachis hypogaea]
MQIQITCSKENSIFICIFTKMEQLRAAWAAKTIVMIIITSILFQCVCGVNHTVGETSGWDLTSNIQAWASSATFSVGDDLVFLYTPVYDVVEVNQQGYDTCTIANAMATYSSGETVIHLTVPGTRYFVCGRLGHCQQGLKLQVQVQTQAQGQTQSNNNGAPPHSSGNSLPAPPHSAPDTPPADVPESCDCSRADHMLTSITLVITTVILSSARASFLFPLKHHLLLVFT